MEITNTIVTRSAVRKTEAAVYHAEYMEENGTLARVQCNVHKPDTKQGETGDYIGSLYLDRNMLSCSLPYGEDAATHFEIFTAMVAVILQTTPLYVPAEKTEEETERQIR